MGPLPLQAEPQLVQEAVPAEFSKVQAEQCHSPLPLRPLFAAAWHGGAPSPAGATG